MAKSYSTVNGTLKIPGAYSSYSVASQPSGLSTTGVLMLVGEADAGDDFSAETDLEANAFGPDQVSDVVTKYRSGPLVDAFRAAASAANDPEITSSFNRCIMVKTNIGAKASANLPKIGGGTYAVLADKSSGKPGNMISYRTTSAQAETVPTTAATTLAWIPNADTVAYGIRVNGGASVGSTLVANRTPAQFVSDVNGLAGVDATGGANRGILTVAGTLTLDVNPGALPHANNVLITRSVAWAAAPSVGDTLIIPTGSIIAGLNNANVGAYLVLTVGAATVIARKLSDAGAAGPVAGVVTAPTEDKTAPADADLLDTPQTIGAVTDVSCHAPVVINHTAAAVIDGVGKSMEIAELTTGNDLLSRCLFSVSASAPLAYSKVSTLASPQLITSGAEYRVSLAAARTSDRISESWTAGGEVVMSLGYIGATCSLVITDTALTTTCSTPADDLSLTLSDFANVQELADYINSLSPYVATATTVALGTLPVSVLDNVTTTAASAHGVGVARIKDDGYRFYHAVVDNSQLVQVGDPAAQAGAGLPDVMAASLYLSGASKGSTADSDVVAALAALELCQGNFVVPLFSRDATSDKADSLTESGSSYTIAGVHAAVKSHVLAMSTLKRRKNRQAFLSVCDTFSNAKDTASNIASWRCCMPFQDVKEPNSAGTVTQFLPWMAAVKAAGMQAAGFYRNIEFKGINISGALQRAGDFDSRNDSQLEDALSAGLMPIKKAAGGGWTWASDQTTYGRDDNFVFNSVQAVYAADVIALTTAQRMETAFAGKSPADISAATGLSFLEVIMADMFRLKLIAASDDALKGWKNGRVQILGNVMKVSLEIKLATALDFITIDFLVAPVVQTAG